MTIKQFSLMSGVSDALIRAVVRQFGTWHDFTDSAEDIAENGASGGWNGFTYYSDTIRFARKNRHRISNMAWEQARELGMDTLDMVLAFNGSHDDDKMGAMSFLSGGSYKEDYQSFYNLMSWYALEEVARAYVDTREPA
jgi:hypothetical protein